MEPTPHLPALGDERAELLGELSLREQQFVLAYVTNGHNGAEAYRLAYGKVENAKQHALTLLDGRPDIRDAIEQQVAIFASRCAVSYQKVVAELAKIGFANPQDYHTVDAMLKPLHSMERDDAAAIKKLVHRTSTDPATGDQVPSIEIELHDKVKALKAMAEMLNPLMGKGSARPVIQMNFGSAPPEKPVTPTHQNESDTEDIWAPLGD